MAHRSETHLLVLHGLRLKGFGEPVDIAIITGVEETTVVEILGKAAADGLAVRRDGARLSGWSLTAEGRARQEELLAEELAAAGLAAAVKGAYEQFLTMNQPLLALCTDWQMIDETTINDHADEDYDREVVERLVGHHAGIEPVLDQLADALHRYGGYRPRFENAIDRLASGDGDWFTKPTIDSYHTVWFQLHEDLLNTLGIERSKESIR